MDRCIIGLGNPGKLYEKNRHNVGFLFVDYCVKELSSINVSFKKKKHYEFLSVKNFLFIKPMTFMNNSGIAVKEIIDFHNIKLEDVMVCFDDVSLPFGVIRIRKKGSDGGHNGLKSIIDELGTTEFPRLRFGIGPKPDNVELKDFVLADFDSEELSQLDSIFSRAKEAIFLWKNKGIDFVMSSINKKVKPAPQDIVGS